MELILYVLFFGAWASLIYSKNGFNISCFIVTLYLIGSIFSNCIFCFYTPYIEHPERITWLSVICHIVLLWLFMYPLVRFGNAVRADKLKLNLKALDIYSWAVAVPSLLSVLVSGFDVVQIFAFGNFLDARMAAMGGEISNLYVSRFGVLGYIISFGPQLSFISTFLAFYYKFYLNKNNLLANLLVVCSLSIVLNNLAITGREGLIRWIFYCASCAVFFKKYIKYKNHKLLFNVAGIFLALIMIMFSLITSDRFEEDDYGPFFSILRYGGEQFFLFSYDFNRFFDSGYGSLAEVFPVITQQIPEIYDINSKVYADYYLNTFSTFVGTFLKEAGFWPTFALAVFSFICLSMIFWRKSKFICLSLTKLIGFLFYYEVVLLGFFYFLHIGRMTQLSMVVYILLAWAISHSSRKLSRVKLITYA